MTSKTAILFFLTIHFLVQCSSSIKKAADKSIDDNCTCDTLKAEQTILDKKFNRIENYDTISFHADSLYSLSREENRKLWYRDIESPDTTKFTQYWNAYLPTNYRANHLDFVKYYENKPETEIAFQFGPNKDLWAYQIFVIKKIDCCYLVTRSYFRHARFTYKAYSIINKSQLDGLFKILQTIQKTPIDTVKSWNYRGYFADNRNKKKFYIDFKKVLNVDTGEPPKEVKDLYDFVDEKIKWKATYELN